MTSIWDRSATAASNTGTPPAGFPENQLASLVDDQFRAEMAFETEFVHSIVAGGTADALTVTYTNAPASLTDGMEIHVRAAAANATTTPTLNVNALGAKTITKVGGTALVAGDISGNLHELTLRYNLANTRWELLNPATVDNTKVQGLGTAATLNVGTAANNIPQLNGSAQLPSLAGATFTGTVAAATGLNVGGGAPTDRYIVGNGSGVGVGNTIAINAPTGSGLEVAINGGDILRAFAGHLQFSETSGGTLNEVWRGGNISQSIAASGYINFPNGLILQWGTGTTSAGGFLAVTFPLTFPTACFAAYSCINATTTSNVTSVSVASTTTLNVYTTTSGGAGTPSTFFWFAVGH